MRKSSSGSGLVVSDLHLFSRRSEGEARFGEMVSRIETAKALVLNGDTFDFRWSRLSSEAATVHAAVGWLESLCENHPHADVHFLLGNHDCLAVFQRELDQLARSHPKLHCHEHRLRLGGNLFLHGDCANRRMDAARLEKARRRWVHDRQRGRLAAAAYDAADVMGLSRRVHEIYFPRHGTVRRIAHHLDHAMPGWHRRVRRCFFGHTHRPFRDYEWRGVRFSNTGSAIRGMGFQPLEFQWCPDNDPGSQ